MSIIYDRFILYWKPASNRYHMYTRKNLTAQRGSLATGHWGLRSHAGQSPVLGSGLKMGTRLLRMLEPKEAFCSHLSVADSVGVYPRVPASPPSLCLPYACERLGMLPSFEGHSLLSPWPEPCILSIFVIQSLPTSF